MSIFGRCKTGQLPLLRFVGTRFEIIKAEGFTHMLIYFVDHDKFVFEFMLEEIAWAIFVLGSRFEQKKLLEEFFVELLIPLNCIIKIG